MIHQPQHWIAPDGHGEMTAWDLADVKAVAVAREFSTHPTVWRLLETTAVAEPELVDGAS